jgi:uncharacterized protein (DUF608 family)
MSPWTPGLVIEPSSPRDEAGVPLGGIGAGKVEFCADGRFTNITINNNLDCPITDDQARTPMMPRVIEGYSGSVYENSVRRRSITSPEGLPGGWLAVHTPQDGARLLKTKGRPAFTCVDRASIDFEGRFPVAAARYSGFTDLDLALEAFSSFDLIDESPDYRMSSLPLALFALTARNTGRTRYPLTLVMSWQNLSGVGGYAGTPINLPDRTPPAFRRDDAAHGLWFDHDPAATVDPRTLGDYSLRAVSSRSDAVVSHHAGWDPARDGTDIWLPLSRGGRLGDVTGPGRAGALAITVPLDPSESVTTVFALAWHVPHLLAADTRWDHLVRPSSAPPPPTDSERPDYGHAYQRWFADSWEVAGYGLREWQPLRERVRGWHQALQRSSLPERMALALPNDLCALVTATWYTRDGRYAMNESPTDMNGCMGTLDQRGAGCAAVATMFAGLDRSELELFARDQVRSGDDPRRFGLHWDVATGRFDRPLDRAGAILHDVGWDHLEGGRLGDAKWTSAHWPELTSQFVLQVYQHAQLTGDREWLALMYPRMQEALRFQDRLDQDGDGVPDLWGAGSCTYDTELYPYLGAAAYVTSLYLAALAVMRQLATERDDRPFLAWTDARFAAAQRVMEEDLWSERSGHYVAWRTTGSPELPAAGSPNSHISQLAGAWWTEILDLPPVVDPSRRRRALEAIHRLNVLPMTGCPADEASPDGEAIQSMAALSVAYYASHAIAAGLADLGWEAVERIYRVRYELDGCPWDSPLQWSGPGNELPQWGRWYMSSPSSWSLLRALGGVRIDRLRNRLTLAPCWPSTWPDELDLPVFLPGMMGRVRARRGGEESVSFHIDRLVGGPVRIDEVLARAPSRGPIAAARLKLPSGTSASATIDDQVLVVRRTVVLAEPGDGVTVEIEPRPAGSASPGSVAAADLPERGHPA